jgi:hypothetical protein
MKVRTSQPGDATLEIGVDQAIPGGAEWGYVAQLRDVTEGRAPADRDSLSGLVIPVGAERTLATPVKPGRYLVEAFSPSGSTLEAEVQVDPGQTASVRLKGEEASQDWLAWQAVSGNLERAQSAAAPPAGVAGSAWRLGRWAWQALTAFGGLGFVFLLYEGGALLKSRAASSAVSLDLPASRNDIVVAQVQPMALVDKLPPWLFPALAVAAGLYVLWKVIDAVVAGPPAAPTEARQAGAPAAAVAGTAAVATGAIAPLDVALVRTPHGRSEWDAILKALQDARAFAAPLEGPPAPLAPAAHDETWRTFTIDLDEPYGGPAAWVLDTTEGARGGLAKLPAPWRGEAGVSPVDVLAPVASARAGRLSATVRDPKFATLLGYLAGGRLVEAQAIVAEAARDALFEKFANPYAAAAGGYVLLATETDFAAKDAPWRQWLANLDQGFPWLPDGAVLHGYSLIQTGGEGARAKLLEAYERGVPVYTEGLRRLRDGLTFVLDDDPEGRAKAAYDVVNEIAGRCDAQQAFTCLRLGR